MVDPRDRGTAHERSIERGRDMGAGDGEEFAAETVSPIDALKKSDPILGRWISRIGAFTLKPERRQNSFEALAESILYQQISGKAAASIFAKVKPILTPEGILRAPASALRKAGVSRPKRLALKDLASKTAAGLVPTVAQMRRLEDEAIIERLTSVRGIGRWTAQMLLMFRLGRPDVLPATDYGIRKGFERVYRTRELPAPREIEARGERWRPFRSIASWYLWRSLELSRGTRLTRATV